jgi:hypothetical protein
MLIMQDSSDSLMEIEMIYCMPIFDSDYFMVYLIPNLSIDLREFASYL